MINCFGTNEFFINKAIWWALQEYSKINPKWVKDFIDKNNDKMINLSIKEEVKELIEYSKENQIKIEFIKIDTLEKAKNVPCIFNNWANFYKGKFISNIILNANSFEKLIK